MQFINTRVTEKVTVEAGITGNAADLPTYGQKSWFSPNHITCTYSRIDGGEWETGRVGVSGAKRLKDGSLSTKSNISFEWLWGGVDRTDIGVKGAPEWVQDWVRANTPKS